MLRKLWRRLFPGRRLRLDTIRFLCEQDGEVERELKEKLVELFETMAAETRAYLVRAELPHSSDYDVMLVLVGYEQHDLLRGILDVFTQIFAGDQHLDVGWIGAEQEGRVSSVAHPFYVSI